MQEKLRFILEYERDEETMTELCDRYGISRETGYLWLRRYRACRLTGLTELNRAPGRHPNQTPEDIAQAVLELREAHGRWGPRKLKLVLKRGERGESGRRRAPSARSSSAAGCTTRRRSGR